MSKLALADTLTSTTLTGKLKAFRSTHPEVQLLLRTARSNDVSAMVESGKVHIGLRYFHNQSLHLHSQAISEEKLVVACSTQSHEITNWSNVDTLRERPWISFPIDERSSGDPFARILRRQLAIAELEDVEIITIDSLTAQKPLIESGFGVGLWSFSNKQHSGRTTSWDVANFERSRTANHCSRCGSLSQAGVSKSSYAKIAR